MPANIVYGSADTGSPKAATVQPLAKSDSQQHLELPESQGEVAPTRTKTAPNNGCRKVDESSSSSTAGKYPISKPSGQLHQDAQGSLSPMERFVKLNLASDPSPWETKKVLNELGFKEGHGNDSDQRLNEAAVTAVGLSLRRAGGTSIFAVARSV